jgi:hypothetical protein
MSEETPQIIPITGSGDKRIQTLEARKEQLLQRKNLAKDSFVKKHIDYLLLEVEDLITKYGQSTTMRRRKKNN